MGERVRLENIGSGDIYESNLKLIMGLIWTLILHYQINQMDLDIGDLEESKGKKKLTAKDKLLFYCKNLVDGYPIKVNNLTNDFSDGKVLACMIHAKKPDALDTNTILKSDDKLENVKKVINALEGEFEVPHVIAPEDIVDEPDEKAMMTFLSCAIKGLEKFPTVATELGEQVNAEPKKAEK